MAHYNLIFQGKIVEGASLDEVKNNVSRLFKADAAKTAALFSGKSIVIKKNLDSESTKKYLAIMKKAGAIIRAVKIEEESATPPSQTVNTTENNNSSSPPAPGGLSAGLASLTNYNKLKEQPSEAQENESTDNNNSLQLAPVGSNILEQSAENEAADIPDTSHLSLSEAETGSLEEFAKQVEPVELPDIDSLTLSEANTGSMEEFTKKVEAIELPDISDLDMAEQDNTPLSTGTSKASPIDIPDTSDITMSDVEEGTLEGIEKKPEAVEIPDISHLTTEDKKNKEKENDDSNKKGNITGKATFQIN